MQVIVIIASNYRVVVCRRIRVSLSCYFVNSNAYYKEEVWLFQCYSLDECILVCQPDMEFEEEEAEQNE